MAASGTCGRCLKVNHSHACVGPAGSLSRNSTYENEKCTVDSSSRAAVHINVK